MYIPLQLSCLHNGAGCYQRYERFQGGSGKVMGHSRRKDPRYHEGARPEVGRRSRPRTHARRFVIRAPARGTSRADFVLTMLL
jgi:hypothetical protein